MILTSDVFPEYTCEVTANPVTGEHVGVLRYFSAERGEITGPDLAAVQAQFHTIADYARDGAIVRENIIITNYFNRMEAGDVLDMDGMILGSWKYTFDEWCDFTEDGAPETEFGAPSLWMLHDIIIKWYKTKNATA